MFVYPISQWLLIVLVLGIANAGLALFLRALPWPRSWLDVKPLACAVCMNGWAGFATLAAVRDELIVGWPIVQITLTWCALIAIGAPIFVHVFPPPLAFPNEP